MRSLIYGVRDSLHISTESGRVTYAGFMCRGLPFDATGPVLDDAESHLLRSSHSRGTSAHMASDTLPSGAREKVALKKGFGLMDWVKLMNSAADIGGVKRFGGMREYTMEEVAQHNTEHDCWGVFMGKVYNLTPYLQYHPGGVDILVKTAGKDCTALFNRYHAWVNLEGIAGKLVIGTIAASDASAAQAKSPSAARARPLPMDAPPPKLKLGLNITEAMGPEDGSEGKDEKGSQGASDLDKSGDSSK